MSYKNVFFVKIEIGGGIEVNDTKRIRIHYLPGNMRPYFCHTSVVQLYDRALLVKRFFNK